MVIDDKFSRIDDFFELLEYSAEKKTALVSETPYLMDFIAKAFYSKDEPVSDDMQNEISKKTEIITSLLLKQIDFPRFKHGVSPAEIMQMLIWMGDGYLREKLLRGTLNIDDMNRDFKKWSEMFKKMAYKEEYLNECDRD